MMNKSKSLCVTLLEILLVLGVASVIILMSVKFYKSAGDSSQVNSVMQTIQGITAAADGIAQNDGSYAGATSTAIATIAGSKIFVAPWGSTITIAANATGYTLTFTNKPGTQVCDQLILKMGSNPKYVFTATCTTVTYDSTK